LRARRELFVLKKPEKFDMHSEPMPETTLKSGDAMSPLYSSSI